MRTELLVVMVVSVSLLSACSASRPGEDSPTDEGRVDEPTEDAASAEDDEQPEDPPDSDPAPGLGAEARIAADSFSSCMAHSDGNVSCWGSGLFPERGEYPSPVTLAAYADAEAVALLGLGRDPCVIQRDRTVSCGPQGSSEHVANLEDVRVLVAARGFGACAVDGSGSVFCRRGELYEGAPEQAWEPVDSVDDARTIVLGWQHGCVLHLDGSVSCWELNDIGQPDGIVKVPGIENAMSIAAGAYLTCVVHADGTVSCWEPRGDDASPDGTDEGSGTEPEIISEPVEGLGRAVSVVAGEAFACALHPNGGVSCWGQNSEGQLGDGTTERRATPVRVVSVDDAVALAAGDRHACALRPDDQFYCWGSNSYGQLGNGTPGDAPGEQPDTPD